MFDLEIELASKTISDREHGFFIFRNDSFNLQVMPDILFMILERELEDDLKKSSKVISKVQIDHMIDTLQKIKDLQEK